MPKHELNKRVRFYNGACMEIIFLILFPCLLIYSVYNIMTKFYVLPWLTQFHVDKFLISLVLTMILHITTDVLIKHDVIRFLLKIIIITSYIPISVVFICSEYSYGVYLIFFAEVLITILTVLLITLKKDNIYVIKDKIKAKLKFEKLKNKINISKIICILFILNTIVVLLACVFYNKLPTLKALNFKDVYEVRENFYLPKILLYLYNFDVKFIIPFFIILCLTRKKYLKLILPIIILVLFFLWKGDKIVLFSIPLTIGTFYLFKLIKNKKVDRSIIGIILLVLIFTIILGFFRSFTAYSLVIRRNMLVPANLKFVHIDFFQNNPKIGIIGTIFNAVLKIDSPYQESDFTKLIGKEYFNSPNTHANTGFLSEGFARCGYIGVIINPIILGLVLCVIHYGVKKNNLSFIAGISILPIYSLNDGYLIPSLTFGSIGLLIIICIFFSLEELDKGSEKLDEYKDVTR